MPDRRLYAQFTLDYADSHKIAPLSDAAFRAHVRMILWSRRMLTDGRIPAAMALVLCDRKKKVLTELTTNDSEQPSLTVDENGDYFLHDFLDHQQSAAQVEANRATNRANGAKGGAAKAARTRTELAPEPPPTATEPLADRYQSVSELEADFYTESETETTTKTGTTRHVLETAISPDDDEGDGRSRRRQILASLGVTDFDRVLTAIARHVDRPISEEQAVQIVTAILGRPKAHPTKPQAYVVAAIEKSWAEIQQQLDESVAA